LKDNDFLSNIERFKWILECEKPILGICGGMQVIGMIFGGKVKKEQEIGFSKENFYKNFLGLFGEKEVYHLHNYYVDFSNNDFKIFAGGSVSQAVKHHEKEIYGVLFHPEVRQKDMIRNFLNIGNITGKILENKK
jgi:GMP synthase (glutamine-hydrolysing)